eukprot:scaffold151164_cov31-Prasinocladus_malaysianus.AAC.3
MAPAEAGPGEGRGGPGTGTGDRRPPGPAARIIRGPGFRSVCQTLQVPARAVLRIQIVSAWRYEHSFLQKNSVLVVAPNSRRSYHTNCRQPTTPT